MIPTKILEIAKAVQLSDKWSTAYPRYEVQTQVSRNAAEEEDVDHVVIVYEGETFRIDSEEDIKEFFADSISEARSEAEADPEDAELEARLLGLEESLELACFNLEKGDYDDMQGNIKEHFDHAQVVPCAVDYKTESVHLSESAANEYMENHPHRLTKPRLWVGSNHNSHEMCVLHDWLMSLDVGGAE
jgi:hypothetical protein